MRDEADEEELTASRPASSVGDGSDDMQASFVK